jgi:hypothetical protein
LEEKGQIDPRRSNQMLLLENERMSGGGKELVTLVSEVREVGGARGGEVSGEKLACVDDSDSCGNTMKLGEDESAGDKRMDRGKQFGPSGLDLILHGEELEGGCNIGVAEVGVGLNEVGPGWVALADFNENPNPVACSVNREAE